MMCHAIQQTDMATKDVEAQRFLENAQTAQSNEDRAANTDALDRAVHTAPPPAKECRHEHGEFGPEGRVQVHVPQVLVRHVQEVLLQVSVAARHE